MSRTFWIETLGCPKNQVDSDKLAGRLDQQGLILAEEPGHADVIVVNTCAFVESAREESINTVLDLAAEAGSGAEVIVTGCMAERYADELAANLPEVTAVVGFGQELLGPHAEAHTHQRVPAAAAASAAAASVPVSIGPTRVTTPNQAPAFDLLNLPRPKSSRPWAYVKIAEGCDRACGFCAIPTFRGPQRSRSIQSIVEEVSSLEVREAVLVAQDLAAFGRDQGRGARQINELVLALADHVDWIRLLYLYPSDLDDRLIETILSTGVSYFDLSLQHASGPHLRRMKRWGDGARFLDRIARIRAADPDAAFRSNVIVGYPGETEEDQDELLRFVEEAQLDWLGVFAYSPEEGTYAQHLEAQVDPGLMAERVAEVAELADRITMAKRSGLVGRETLVLVDEPGCARSSREAPEIDGVVHVPSSLEVGEFHRVTIVDVETTDVVAEPVDRASAPAGVEGR